MVEISSRAYDDDLEAGQWSQRQTFVFVVASSLALWALIGTAVFAVL